MVVVFILIPTEIISSSNDSDFDAHHRGFGVHLPKVKGRAAAFG
ncbi:hypothetical protein [Magnetospirillum sp. 64-120]|nr:hypothetical protein [Magnetospirillum sp. 64-120]